MKRFLSLLAICTISFASMQAEELKNGDFSTPIQSLNDSTLLNTDGWWICQQENGHQLVTIENYIDNQALMNNSIKLENGGEHTFNDGYLMQKVNLDKEVKEYMVSMRVKNLKGDTAQIGAFFASTPIDINTLNTTAINFDVIDLEKSIENDGWYKISKKITTPIGKYFCVWLNGNNESVLIDDVSITAIKKKNDKENEDDKDENGVFESVVETDTIILCDPIPEETWNIKSDLPIKTFLLYEPGSRIEGKIKGAMSHGNKIEDKGYIGYMLDVEVITNNGGDTAIKGVHKDLLIKDKKTLYDGKLTIGPDFKWAAVNYKNTPEGVYKSYMGNFSILVTYSKEDLKNAEGATFTLTAQTSDGVVKYTANIDEEILLIPTFTVKNGKYIDFPKDGEKLEGPEAEELKLFISYFLNTK